MQGIGIRTITFVTANVVYNTSAVLTTVGLTSPIAVNQRQKVRAWVMFSTGATGGMQFQLVTPAATTLFQLSFDVYDTVTPAEHYGVQTASAAQGYALANAGTYFLIIDAVVVNGANAGTLDLQFAQNTSQANNTTILKDSVMEVISF